MIIAQSGHAAWMNHKTNSDVHGVETYIGGHCNNIKKFDANIFVLIVDKLYEVDPVKLDTDVHVVETCIGCHYNKN